VEMLATMTKSVNEVAKEIKDMEARIKFYLSEIKMFTNIKK